MKCPLLLINKDTVRPAYDPHITDCRKEECALWNKTQEECNLVTITVELYNTSCFLKDIRDKMPHAWQFTK